MLLTSVLSFGSIALLPFKASAVADVQSEDSFEEDLREFLAEDVNILDRRSAANKPRLLSYSWEPPPWRGIPGFNISMDFSGCARSVKKDTTAGIYTYSNGTTQDDATAGDILADLNAMRKDAPDPLTAESVMGHHMLTGARTVEAMSNKLLDGGLICESPTGAPNGEVVHDELRRLLWWSPEARREM
ncbi:MAG: hypothetical protein L6R39_003722 [Caloplaca ligustica]|nr:MAG: hypothetical protein L6R39_003722 [Caloplaca ligustica]